MILNDNVLWQPLLEATAQTITGALGSILVGKAISSLSRKNSYTGVMDLWQRGIHISKLNQGDNIELDCLISPYSQLFPGDPYENAKRWNSLYSFEGKISKDEYQTLEFFAGSDAALRIGSLNGETIVGLFDRYGFIGEGFIGVVPTKLLLNKLPDFFNSSFYGTRALIKGTLSKCPSQHGFIAQGIALKANVKINVESYKELWYLNVDKIKIFNNSLDRITSLLGSPWAVTNLPEQQYITQYGYISNSQELNECVKNIQHTQGWDNAKVYFDDVNLPNPDLSFKRNFIL